MKKVLLVLILGMFLVNCVTAFDFDNFKTYDGDLKKITIRNTFDWLPLTKVAEYTLDYNTDQCLINCRAEGTAKLYTDGVLFSDLNFKGMNGNYKQLKYSKILIEINELYSEEVSDYELMCSGKDNDTICEKVLTGKHTELKNKTFWKEYGGEILKEGIYKWRIEGVKSPRERIDWIASAFGEDLTEWAWWNSNWNRCKDISIQTSATLNDAIINVELDGLTFNSLDELRFVNTSCGDGGQEIKGTALSNVSNKVNATFLANLSGASVNYSVYYDNNGAPARSDELVDSFIEFTDDNMGEFTENTTTPLNVTISGGTGLITSTGGVCSVNDVGGKNVLSKWYSNDSANSLFSGLTNWTSPNKDYGFGGGKGAGMEFYGFNNGNQEIYGGNGTDFSETHFGAIHQTNKWITGFFKMSTTNTTGWVWNETDLLGTANNNIFPNQADMRLCFGDIAFGGDGNYFDYVRAYDLEANYLYEGDYSITVGSEELASTPPTIYLNIPVNNTNSSSPSVTLNCSGNDETELLNISLMIDGEINQTVSDTGQNNLSLQDTLTFSEGAHNWTCRGTDNENTVGKSGNRTLTIDLTDPAVHIFTPANNTNYLTTTTQSVDFNVSVSDNIALKSCSYFNGTANNSIACGDNATLTLDAGAHELIYYAYDEVDHLGYNSTNVYVNVYNYTVEYATTVLETENNTFYLNVSATNLTNVAANVSYNGTIYALAGSTNGTFSRLSRNLTAPEVDGDVNVNITVYLNLNGNDLVFGNYSQAIYNFPTLNITSDPSCAEKAYNFTILDEANFTILNGTFEYNFRYGLSNNTQLQTYGKIEGESSVYVCMNTTASNNITVGEGEIFYRAVNYVDRRYYLFSGATLTNSTNNITLYDLASADQTSFKLEVEDTSLNPYPDKYTALIRWYPDLDEYNVVDMGETDETGSTVIHVRTEDVDYRIGVYEKNGSILKLAEPIRMVCLVTPCTYTLRISPSDTDYTSFLNVEGSLVYNTSTSLWTFTWTDPTQLTSEMNLTVWKLTGSEIYPVCSNTVSGYAGAVTCNTSAYSGTLKGVVERSASPPVPITEKIIETTSTAFSSPFGLFLSLIIGIPIIFIFAIMSPIGAVVGGVIALIPAYYFGSIGLAVLGGVAVLAGIVLHFLKRI